MQEGMWEEVESVSGQRSNSNQLTYVPSVFSYCFWKPSCLPAFLTFNRFACVAKPVKERGCWQDNS